jgi:hypothetical protein
MCVAWSSDVMINDLTPAKKSDDVMYRVSGEHVHVLVPLSKWGGTKTMVTI